MSIAELCDALLAAHDAYQSAPTSRTKKARYQRMLSCCTKLSNRLSEATAWMDETMYSTHVDDDVWIEVMHKYQRGWHALEEAKAWL